MNLTTARAIVRRFARDAAGSTVGTDDSDLDYGIQAIADDLIRATECTLRTDDVALSLNDSTLPAFPSGFRPELARAMWIPGKSRFERVDHRTLMQLQIDTPLTGLPLYFAFSGLTTGEVYPTPDAGYAAKLQWVEQLTAFTPGTAGSDAITLNVPDDYLRTALMLGASALIQHTDVEHAYASGSYQAYLAYRNGLVGSGVLGGAASRRSMWEG